MTVLTEKLNPNELFLLIWEVSVRSYGEVLPVGFEFSVAEFDSFLQELSRDYLIYAPVRLSGKGAFSDTDLVTYREVSSYSEIEFKERARFSPKETVFPISQTLFYFTEDGYKEPKVSEKGIILFCRSCDVHAFKRLDAIFLNNGTPDNYYAALRGKVKFFVLECAQSYENCFCVSMGTNRVDNYDAFCRFSDTKVICDVQGDLLPLFVRFGQEVKMEPRFVTSNSVEVRVPERIDKKIFNHEMWQEYSERCIACGRCNVVCPTCTCFTMQDIFYADNPNCGERRRVWASCMIDGYTEMAGGHGYRNDKGLRMRFKTMHKISDFKQRFGYQMCVGCGRCDDVCPEYISFADCINKVYALAEEGKGHE